MIGGKYWGEAVCKGGAEGVLTREVSLGTFPLPGGKSRRYQPEYRVTEFKASGRVNKLRNISQRSGKHGASANDKRSSAPASDRAL